MSNYYKEFLITAEPFNSEIISSVLWNLDIMGINEEVNCLKVFSSNLNLSVDDVEFELKKLIENNLLRNFEVQENLLNSKNWNEEWEKSREVIKVTEKIVIKPSFKQYQKMNDEIVIELDPKMSFGTGEHPTTKICIQLIEKYLSNGDNVLDVGCGTAILSIVAAKMGAKKVIGIDIDEWSFENSIENASLNQVDDIVEIRQCTIDEISENNFDLIVANIQKNVLIDLANEIKRRLKLGGTLLLSGLLETEVDKINEVYQAIGFEKLTSMKMDDWIGIAYKRIE